MTGWVALALGACGGVLLAGRAVGLHPPTCALASAGAACPVCGITRVAAQVVGGRPDLALVRDPLGVVLLVALAVVAVAQARALRGRPVGWLARAAVPAGLAGLLLARWALLLATGGPPG